MSTPALKDAAHRFALALVPDVAIDAIRRTRLATTEEGFTRARRIEGQIPMRTMPPIPPEVIEPPEGADADDLADYLASLNLTYLPIADPAFTGTITGPNAAFTGHTNAGNSASDELRVYNLIGQGSAPSFADGGALGTTPGSQTIVGHDISGVILQTTGTGPTTGTLWTVTFANPKANSNYRVFLQARGASSAGLHLYPTTQTTGGFELACGVAPAASTAIAINWFVFGP